MKFFTRALFATAFIGLAMFSARPSDAAIRTVIVDGLGNKQVFFATSDNSATFTGASIGGFSAAIEVVGTNFDGTATLGQIEQTLFLTTVDQGGGGPLDPDLIVTTDVIDTPIGAFTFNPVTGLVLAADNAIVEAATLKSFTEPDGNPLQVSSSVASSTLVGTWSAETTTIFNGTPVLSGLINNPPGGPANSITTVLLPHPGSSYTLRQVVGVEIPVATTVTISATSSVFPTPEPASMVVWGLGAGLIGAVGFFKRRRKVA